MYEASTQMSYADSCNVRYETHNLIFFSRMQKMDKPPQNIQAPIQTASLRLNPSWTTCTWSNMQSDRLRQMESSTGNTLYSANGTPFIVGRLWSIAPRFHYEFELCSGNALCTMNETEIQNLHAELIIQFLKQSVLPLRKLRLKFGRIDEILDKQSTILRIRLIV